MVSPQGMNEIRNLYETLANQKLDIHEYSNQWFDVVFEIITADTYVAGIASKLLGGDTIDPEEAAYVSQPMLIANRCWRCEDGRLFDINPDPKVKALALAIEGLRHKCNEALSQKAQS